MQCSKCATAAYCSRYGLIVRITLFSVIRKVIILSFSFLFILSQRLSSGSLAKAQGTVQTHCEVVGSKTQTAAGKAGNKRGSGRGDQHCIKNESVSVCLFCLSENFKQKIRQWRESHSA